MKPVNYDEGQYRNLRARPGDGSWPARRLDRRVRGAVTRQVAAGRPGSWLRYWSPQGGTLLLRSQFSDHMPRLWWLEYFPRGFEADAAMYEPLAEVTAVLGAADWQVSSFAAIGQPASRTRGQALEWLRLRSLSTFEQFTSGELAVGFERLEQAVAEDQDAPAPAYPETLLTLTRP